MRFILIITGAFLAAFTLNAFKKYDNQKPGKGFNFTEYKKKNIVRCSPDWDLLKDWLEGADIPPIPGAGIYKWNISAKNDSARFYFNQGINMYYSFHLIEAMASFKKAAKFDPASGIIYWAQALTYGPNINDYGYIASADALKAVSNANKNIAGATAFEKALIQSISVRYTADSADATREQLNRDYTGQMKMLYEKFPSNPDAMALYADAMMLLHPWDLWKTDGTPKPWTQPIREVLEKLLAKYPEHPGGNHYYIHVMEPSPYFAKALPSAEKLGKTNPGLSHVVHMPSHIYLRSGHYQKGIDVNNAAVSSYYKSIPLFAAVTNNDFIYIIHNLHMKTNHALMNGQSAVAIKAAEETRGSIPPDYLSIPAPVGNVLQYIYMTPAFVMIRYGKWDEILQLKKPDHSHIYAGLLYHFARGIAFSKKKDFDNAAKELDAMRELMKDTTLTVPMSPFSPASDGAKVAEEILLGVIHEERGLYDGAVRHYSFADAAEEKMVYNEPRDWLLNPKHFLGNAYLLKQQGVEAEKIFRKDLQQNNENGWALYGLYKALLLQKKNKEAAAVLARFKKAFSKADIKIVAPVF